MKNICFSIETFIVLCYYNHVLWHHNYEVALAGEKSYCGAFLFTSLPVNTGIIYELVRQNKRAITSAHGQCYRADLRHLKLAKTLIQENNNTRK